MADTPVVVPELGNEIDEAMVEAVEKQAGDAVAAGDVLLILTTPKVSIEIEAPHAGTVASVVAELDDIVATGDVLVLLAT